MPVECLVCVKVVKLFLGVLSGTTIVVVYVWTLPFPPVTVFVSVSVTRLLVEGFTGSVRVLVIVVGWPFAPVVVMVWVLITSRLATAFDWAVSDVGVSMGVWISTYEFGKGDCWDGRGGFKQARTEQKNVGELNHVD